VLTPEFIDRYAIAGNPDTVLERIEALAALGLDKLAVSGPVVSARDPDARAAIDHLNQSVLTQIGGPDRRNR